jgi:bifunctional oligoribonuclease and PAP phosphatase NrnA
LLGRLLPTLDLRAGGRLASWRMRHKDLRELAITPGDTEGLIEHLRSIEGVIVAVSFEESADGQTVRISARSKDSSIADVAAICCEFGGGGHQLAAGATLPGPLDTAAELFLKTATQTIANGSD